MTRTVTCPTCGGEGFRFYRKIPKWPPAPLHDLSDIDMPRDEIERRPCPTCRGQRVIASSEGSHA